MAGRKIEVEIIGDASSLSRAFSKVEGASSSIGSKLMGLGKVAAVGMAAVGGGAILAGGKMLKMAGDAEEVDSKLDVVFGRQLPGLRKNLESFADATGASSFKLQEQAANMGALLGPLIGTKKGAADMSTEFVKLATDLSSFNNVPVDDALLAIRSGLVGEAEPLRQFGVLLNEAAVKQEALRLGLVKGNEALSEQEKVQARASLIMQQTTQAQGDAERTAGSYTNTVRALKNTVTDLATGLGAELIPAATAVAGGLNDFINKISEADGAGAKFGVALDALKQIAVTAWNGIKQVFNSIDWGAVGDVLANGLRAALGFLSRIDYGGILKTVATTAFNALKTAFNAIDWGAVGDTVGNALMTALRRLTEFINRVNWNQVGQAIVQGMGVAIKALASFLAGLDYPAILAALTRGVIAVLRGLGSLVIGLATAVGRNIVQGMQRGAVALWGGFKSWLSGLPGQIQGVFSGAAGWLYDEGLAVLQGFWDGLRAKWDAVAGWVGGLGGKIKGLKGPESEDAKLLVDEGKAIILGLESGMMTSWDQLAPKINALGGNIISNFILGISSKQPEFTGKLAQAATAALDAARAAVEAGQTKVTEAFGKLGDLAKKAFDARTKGMLEALSAKFDVQIEGIQAFARSLTPAELALRQLDEAEQASARSSALAAAQRAVDAAQAIADETERNTALIAAKEQLRVAELAIRRSSLEEQAAIERQQRDNTAALQIRFLEEQKQREATNLEERRAQLATKMEEQLAVLVEKLTQHPKEYDKTMKQVTAVLASYGVTLKKSGATLGEAFAKGLRSAADDVESAVKFLAKIVADYIRLKSPAKKGPLSSLDSWWKPMGPMLAAQIDGGAIAAGAGRLAGSAMAAPGGRFGGVGGGGVTYVTVNMPGYLGDKREAARAIQDELRNIDRTETGGRTFNSRTVLS